MEGISGVYSSEYVVRGERYYPLGQQLLTAEVNAAVRGAFDGGAREVIVADMHGMSGNMLVNELDERALLLAGTPRQPRFPFLDGSVDGMLLIGYHAMAGTPGACLEHTMTSQSWHRMCVNGTPYGELGIDAAIAAEAGVPVIMVSGDDCLCSEAENWLPGVEAAMVKQGVGRCCALGLSPARGRERVYACARRAVQRLAAGESFALPQVPSPAAVTITYTHTTDADAACAYGTRRLDAYTVETVYQSLSHMYGGLWAHGGHRLG